MDQPTYTLVKNSIKKILNLNLEYYKDEQMRRRLDSWLVRTGEQDWNIYFRRMKTDASELRRFRDYLTINVSTFFRDPERWVTLRDQILPELHKGTTRMGAVGAGLNIWSAGCSIGAEPYSLSMLIEESTPNRSYRILASDIDHGALGKARQRGPYNTEDLVNLNASQRKAFLEPGGPPFHIAARMTRKIEFREHNLLTDAYPEGFDLIVCRNVVIYFTSEAKDLIYRGFARSLRPGGVLFVGATEIIPRPQEIGLRTYGYSFYRKD